ncbi:MAG: RNA-binding protein [Acidobacteria bacterium]|nr:RNA-binding protein [Acidobacteriota bacterium]
MSKKLFVGNLSFQTSSGDLEQLFTEAGRVESATVVTDRYTGQSRGFGFVEMSTQEECEKAIAELNGRELDGRALTVNIARPREESGRPSGGGHRRSGDRGGFRGGNKRW